VGVVHEGEVWIGADSAAVDLPTGLLTYHGQGKVFQEGEFLVGYSTSFRMGDILRCHLQDILMRYKGQDALGYMTRTFAEEVRRLLREYGWATVENNVETGGRFLVGYQQGLYFLDSDYHVTVPLNGYLATGSGEAAALGSLYSTQGMRNPQARLLLALQAAQHHNVYVREPFLIKRLEYDLPMSSPVVK
jgi:hypothetical protein